MKGLNIERHLDGFIESENSYVITNRDKQLLTYKSSIGDISSVQFRDKSIREVSNIVIFSHRDAAEEFIKSLPTDNYKVEEIEVMFKEEQ